MIGRYYGSLARYLTVAILSQKKNITKALRHHFFPAEESFIFFAL